MNGCSFLLLIHLLPAAGLEPARGCPQQILSLHRLPFRHAGLLTMLEYHDFQKNASIFSTTVKKRKRQTTLRLLCQSALSVRIFSRYPEQKAGVTGIFPVFLPAYQRSIPAWKVPIKGQNWLPAQPDPDRDQYY